jgi:hypothetical protein
MEIIVYKEKKMEIKSGLMDAITVQSTKNKYYPSNWGIKWV